MPKRKKILKIVSGVFVATTISASFVLGATNIKFHNQINDSSRNLGNMKLANVMREIYVDDKKNPLTVLILSNENNEQDQLLNLLNMNQQQYNNALVKWKNFKRTFTRN